MSKPRRPRVRVDSTASGELRTKKNATELAVPIGSRVVELLEIGHRARRPVLLEGPTGIGKSQIVGQFAKAAGLDYTVLDLSLLEPPDLIGLPVIEGGQTHYARPAELPSSGTGVLMLEELNRAELPVMQPALQLLSARRLHSYELPPGWSCVAAINPEDGDYQVNRLDPALRTRFMQLRVCADRSAWLGWAERQNVHPAVLRMVSENVDAFESASPRSWTYASDVLHGLRQEEYEDVELVRVALRGFLPTSWSIALVEALGQAAPAVGIEVEELLGPAGPAILAKAVTELSADGRIDAIAMLSARIRHALSSDALLARAQDGSINVASLEALLEPLPGDYREQCLTTAVRSDACSALLRGLGYDPSKITRGYRGSSLQKELGAWRAGMKLHLVQLALTCAERELRGLADDAGDRAAVGVSLGALVADAGVLGADLERALRARGLDPARERA